MTSATNFTRSLFRSLRQKEQKPCNSFSQAFSSSPSPVSVNRAKVTGNLLAFKTLIWFQHLSLSQYQNAHKAPFTKTCVDHFYMPEHHSPSAQETRLALVIIRKNRTGPWIPAVNIRYYANPQASTPSYKLRKSHMMSDSYW